MEKKKIKSCSQNRRINVYPPEHLFKEIIEYSDKTGNSLSQTIIEALELKFPKNKIKT